LAAWVSLWGMIHSGMTTGFQYHLSDIDQRYDLGRKPTPGAIAALAGALRDHAPVQVRRVLDLGCGTGRFSHLLAETFGTPVFAVEPAANMLAAAAAKEPAGGLIKFLRGSAVAIPAATGAFDLVFISQVLHHLPDPAVAMAEIRRVLAIGGRMFVRQSTLENLDSCLYQRFFPEARAVDEQRLPSRARIIAAAQVAGLLIAPTLQTIRVEVGRSVREYVKKIATRALSDLAMIPDDAFARGMEEFSRYADAHPDQVWFEEIDHLIFTAT
jgi:ubiquinone/menaquinone biosynthesis C-methylase UbiE